MYWISQGAQVSDAVHNILIREGVLEGKKIAKKMPRPVVKEAAVVETPLVATPAETAAPVAEVAPVVEAPVVEGVETPTTPVAEVKVETPVEPVVAEEPKA